MAGFCRIRVHGTLTVPERKAKPADGSAGERGAGQRQAPGERVTRAPVPGGRFLHSAGESPGSGSARPMSAASGGQVPAARSAAFRRQVTNVCEWRGGSRLTRPCLHSDTCLRECRRRWRGDCPCSRRRASPTQTSSSPCALGARKGRGAPWGAHYEGSTLTTPLPNQIAVRATTDLGRRETPGLSPL